MLPSGLLVIHDARRRRQDNIAKLPRRQQLHHPLLQIAQLHVVPRTDHPGLVQAAVELDDNLAVTVVVDLFNLSGT